jgi:hypothetical protein
MNDMWTLIDRVNSLGVDENIPDLLIVELSRRPISAIRAFHAALMQAANEALTWDLWAAATVIHRASCSEDMFCYFRLWLVAQGRRTFEDAVRAPDTLATHPKILHLATKPPSTWEDRDFPHMEGLLAVAEEAFDRIIEKFPPDRAAQIEFPDEIQERPREVPTGRGWDFTNLGEMRRRLPELTDLFR